MNRAYRLVWNACRTAYVPVPEHARSHSAARAMKVAMGAAVLSLLAGNVFAMPTGGQVSFGAGTVSQSGSTMTIRQDSQNLGLNWQSFGIGSGEAVTFVQPSASSIALNRVLGSDPSAIYGRLSANGQVWLLNPNGVLFGSGALVNVGGLVASTLNISDSDFLAGKRTFSGSGGTVSNNGTLTAADGGYIALLGSHVSNEGVIQARLGTVALAAGKQVTLDFAGDRLVNLQVDQGAVDALVENKQLIRADGGQVLMTAQGADAVLSAVVNNQGVIEAQTVDTSMGVIRLLGGKNGGTVNVAGTLDASAPNGGQGGLVETSGYSVKVADDARITTASASGSSGATGTWLIDPTNFTIAANGGDITGATLGNQLTRNNVTILSSQGSTGGVGDIRVNDSVTWSSTNNLTLSALHDVRVARPITSNGSGAVTLRADNTGACVAGAVNCGTVRFVGQGHVTLNGGALNIYYNPKGSNLKADANGNGPSYATPTDFSSDVTLRKGSTLTAWMLINDVNQLQAINTNLSGSYALGRDIDASATNNWNGGAGFVPLGFDDSLNIFSGQFDGSGHVISSLTINRPTENFVGLFGVSRGSIVNVGLTDVDVRGNESVGGLIGRNESGLIGNSYVTGTVTGNSDVGGLVGSSMRDVAISPRIGLISDSHFEGSVNGGSNVGGLVGFGVSDINDSYATGQISGGNNVGGLVGNVAGSNQFSPTDGGLINGSHFTGIVSGDSNVGGLVGSGMYHLISDSYATGQVSGGDYVGGLVGNVAFLSVSNSHFTGSVKGEDYVGGLIGSAGFTTISNSYSAGQVTGVADVGGLVGATFSSRIDGSYSTSTVVGQNDVGGLVGINDGTIDHSYATGDVTGRRVVGGLVGDNVGEAPVISNSYANGHVAGGFDVGGLVGHNGGRIENSHAKGDVTDVANGIAHDSLGGLVGVNDGSIETSYATGNVVGWFDVGGLAGTNRGTISHSYATGSVGADIVGGLVGNNGGAISDSYATGSAAGDYAGGLVGINSGTIVRSHASGNASAGRYGGGLVGLNYGSVFDTHATGTVSGGDYIGGLVGANYGSIAHSFATGNVTAPYGYFVGGLVGDNGSVITDTYASGNVRGYGDVGGLVGMNRPGGTISASYSTGAVSGQTAAGGLVGLNEGIINSSYWDMQTAGTNVGVGSGSASGATGLTDQQMKQKASFVGFDFSNAWDIVEGSTYPFLR